MSETTQAIEHCPANLRTLYRELEEMATKIKKSSQAEGNPTQVLHAPVVVIRGK